MGRTSATLLLLSSLAACGDNVDDGTLAPGPDDVVHPNGNGDVIPRYVPRVCGVNSWSSPTDDPSMNLSVVQRPTGGATLLSAPRAGGAIYGFNLDPRMDMIGHGQKVLDGTFDNVSVS